MCVWFLFWEYPFEFGSKGNRGFSTFWGPPILPHTQTGFWRSRRRLTPQPSPSRLPLVAARRAWQARRRCRQEVVGQGQKLRLTWVPWDLSATTLEGCDVTQSGGTFLVRQ